MASFQLDELSHRYTAVEFAPPDISAYADGNAGIPYVWRFEAAEPGPNVVILGAMHGNEIAGAAVLHRLLKDRIHPLRGSLTLVFGNPQAYACFDAEHPYLGRFIDIDINRVWGAELYDLADNRVEVARSRALKPIVDGADFLLDLHTMQGKGLPVALVTDKPATMDFASRMTSLPFVLSGTMHQADRVRLRDYGRFGDPSDPAVALQVEAGQHWGRDAIGTGLEIAREFLACTGVTEGSASFAETRQRRLKIVETVMPEQPFSFAEDFHSGAHFPNRGALVGYCGPEREEVRTPVDDCFLIMPVHFRQKGGSCCRFAIEEN